MTDTPISSPLEAARFPVILIAMPWAIFNRPSVQLGVLKAYLDQETDWLTVETLYPYLEIASRIGIGAYHWLSRDMWASEALYASILFPELEETIRLHLQTALRKADRSVRLQFDFDRIRDILAEQLTEMASGRDWGRCRLIGFSVCCNQLLSSLAAARIVKERWPSATVVFGGSSCAAEMGSSLLDHFSQIDYLVRGEGEIPLLQLCEFLAGRRQTLPAQILDAHGGRAGMTDQERQGTQIADLSTLPVPDYQDYFIQMRQWFAKEPFIPVLPVEFSRGCWWGKCAFCNLNLQWHGYRAKSSRQMQSEITALAERHGCLDFTFTDNALPRKEASGFFRNIAALGRDLSFFGEIKANLQSRDRRKLFREYRNGGLATMQVGIESLSDSLLTKMEKGTTVIDNIATMKDALENRILLEGNLITEFPDSCPEEVSETLANLDFVLPFHPLAAAAFFLGHGSPVHRNPKRYGIRALRMHPYSRHLFPEPILSSIQPMIKGFIGQRRQQKKLWQPVVRKVRQWQEFHQRRNRSILDLPPLSFREGGRYIIIRQELDGRPTQHHRLQNLSREIYLHCRQIRTAEELTTRFATIEKNRLFAFLQDLAAKRLLFIHNNKFLALAVRQRG